MTLGLTDARLEYDVFGCNRNYYLKIQHDFIKYRFMIISLNELSQEIFLDF